MKTAVVAYINFMEDELEQKAVQVEDSATWKDAYMAAFVVGTPLNTVDIVDWLNDLPSNLDKAAALLADGDMAIKVIFLPCE